MKIESINNAVRVSDFGEINLALTLDCGQAFRWKRTGDGLWHGIADRYETTLTQENGALIFYGTPEKDVREFWTDYFDLNRDYEKILSSFSRDGYVSEAVKKNGTVRILNQPPFETLISFIISSCNNIPRIKGIVNRMCETFGEKTASGDFFFPSPKSLFERLPSEGGVLRAGYRTPYVFDAASRVYLGETDLDAVKKLPENEARKELEKIKGVGRKVADCTMLFSLGFGEVFPTDRHIKRSVDLHYPNGLPECFSPFYGLAQQYIFIAAAFE